MGAKFQKKKECWWFFGWLLIESDATNDKSDITAFRSDSCFIV